MAITTYDNLIFASVYRVGGDWTKTAWQSTYVTSKQVQVYRNRSSVPKFRERIRNGSDATGPYARTWFDVKAHSNTDVASTFKYQRDPGGPLVACHGYVSGQGPYPFSGIFIFEPIAPSSTYYAEARNAALKYLYNRDAEIRHAFQGGVFAGELKQTWDMIKNPIAGLKKGLFGYLDDVQNKMARNRGYLKRLPKKRRTKWINDAIADSWLTFSLGFKPLIHDIEAALKAASNLGDRSESYGLTATGTANGLVRQVTSRNTVNQICANYHERSIEECSVRFKVGIRLKTAKGDFTSELQSQLSLQFADFVPTMWNLLPGSFLYDYVSNIGDVIDAYAHPLAGVIYAVESIKTTRTCEISGEINLDLTKANYGSSFVACGGSIGSATAISGRFERRTSTGNLMPSLQLDFHLSDTQLLNVAALLQKENLVKLLSFGHIK